MSVVDMAALVWLAVWAVCAAVRVDRSLRPDVVQVGCKSGRGGNGSTVCISAVCPSLAAFCVCSKDGEGDQPEWGALVPEKGSPADAEVAPHFPTATGERNPPCRPSGLTA